MTKETDWTRTCWYHRFLEDPCGKPATWRGPKNVPWSPLGSFSEKWRACDAHRVGALGTPSADVPLEES